MAAMTSSDNFDPSDGSKGPGIPSTRRRLWILLAVGLTSGMAFIFTSWNLLGAASILSLIWAFGDTKSRGAGRLEATVLFGMLVILLLTSWVAEILRSN